eukprot:scaffold1941_cov263-Pinguiococcus_pyrenoidosus.AAC.10
MPPATLWSAALSSPVELETADAANLYTCRNSRSCSRRSAADVRSRKPCISFFAMAVCFFFFFFSVSIVLSGEASSEPPGTGNMGSMNRTSGQSACPSGGSEEALRRVASASTGQSLDAGPSGRSSCSLATASASIRATAGSRSCSRQRHPAAASR